MLLWLSMMGLSWSENWCESSDKNIKFTIKKIIKKTRAKSCEKALLVLRVQESIDLSYSGIRDIRPLAEAKQLRILLLRKNTFLHNIEPLRSMSRLRWLDLSQTAVEDINPLQGLHELETLWLSDTKIKDTKAILSLKKLQYLSVSNIGLEDISPFRLLPKLKFFGFARNKVKDLRPLASFGENLESVDLFQNPIVHCPSDAKKFTAKKKCIRHRDKVRKQ